MKPDRTPSNLQKVKRQPFVLSVFLSLLAIPVCFFLSNHSITEKSWNIFLVGMIILLIIPLVLYLYLKGTSAHHEPFYYIFTIFAFTSVIDLILALSIDGYSHWMKFYLEQGEPYMRTAHGLFINYWDGTVHYLLYLWFLYEMSKGREIGDLGLFWVGSVVNSLIVLLPASFLGKYSNEVKESFLLNIPYLFIPLIFGWKIYTKHSPPMISRRKADIPDFLLVVCLFVCIGLYILRGLIAMNSPILLLHRWTTEMEPYIADPSRYPELQLYVYFFYFIPFSVYAIYQLLFHTGNQRKIRDLTAFFAGAAAQGQFAFIGASVHQSAYNEKSWKGVPQTNFHWFVLINGILTLTPILVYLRFKFPPKYVKKE